MIQRIQSVHLLFVVILSSIAFYFPLANLTAGSNSLYELSIKGLYLLEGNVLKFESAVWGVTVSALLIPITALITVFLFKKRKLQIKLCYATIFFVLLFYASLFAYSIAGAERLGADWHISYVNIVPAICLVLIWLALRAIKKDEALVKSLDRLR